MGDGFGLMGEAGSEAILPLKRGPDGRLGVAAGAGGAASQTIVFNVSTPDAGSFRKSEAQVSAMLTRATARGGAGCEGGSSPLYCGRQFSSVIPALSRIQPARVCGLRGIFSNFPVER